MTNLLRCKQTSASIRIVKIKLNEIHIFKDVLYVLKCMHNHCSSKSGALS